LSDHEEVDLLLLEYLVNGSAEDGIVNQQRNCIAQSLTKLHLSRCPNVNSIETIEMLGNVSQLVDLSVSGIAMIDDSCIEALVSRLPHLGVFDISDCPCVTNEGLRSIAKHMVESLTALKASRNSNFTHNGVNEVIMKCEAMDTLEIAKCTNVTFIGIVLETHGMFQFVSRRLKRLVIDSCHSLHPQSLNWVSSALGELEELSMKNIPMVTDSVIQGILTGCLSLRVLHFSGCRRVTNASLKCISEQMMPANNHLTHLALAGIYNDLAAESVSNIFNSSQYLEHVDISHNSGVTDDTFTQLIIRPPSNSTSVDSAPAASAPASRMRTLITGHSGITSYGLACAVQVFTQLEHLNVSGLKLIEDAAIKVVVGCCPNLVHLNLNDCHGLTDAAPMFACRHSKRLQVLYLSFTAVVTDMKTSAGESYNQYTDKTLRAILGRARNLKEVTLCNQLDITLTSKWFFQKFPRRGNFSLQSLDLRGCTHMAGNYLHSTFLHCYLLNDLNLPALFLETDVSTEAFWRSTFRNKIYALPYDGREVVAQRERAKQLMTKVINTKRESVRVKEKIQVKTIQQLEGFRILRPLPSAQRSALAFRDQYYRRRLLENFSARVIQKVWHLFQLWAAIRYRVMARRIINCIRNYRNMRIYAELVYDFTRNRAAKKVQKQYYKYKIIYMNAAKCIQRAYRRYESIRESHLMIKKMVVVVHIQRVARGYIVRISERYTLAQIYLKLPPFWREVMKIKPASMRRANRSKIQPYQIADLKSETSAMVEHILDDVVTGRILPPKMPFVVPQPFDKKPYVSLADGRRLNYDNLSDSLLSAEYREATKDTKHLVVSESSLKFLAGRQAAKSILEAQKQVESKREPLHSFNMKFWPITMKPDTGDTSTTEHDPSLNSFDIIKNTRQHLDCEVCRTRLRIIACRTCMKGYCFFCAFRTHTEAFKRNHEMRIMEPRIVQHHEVSSSLVCHIDMAQSVAHDLGYLIKYMRSAAEVKRIQRERQLLKEFEQQEEAKRIAFLKASQEARDLHSAATVMTCMYRKAKAKEIVHNKRLQTRLEDALDKERDFNNAVLTVQRILRMMSVRYWTYQFGKKFDMTLAIRSGSDAEAIAKAKQVRLMLKSRPTTPSMYKALKAEEKKARIDWSTRMRVLQNRTNIMAGLEELHASVRQIFHANFDYWREKYDKFAPKVEELVALRDGFFEQHKAKQQDNTRTSLTATSSERDREEAAAKILHLKLEAASARVENARNIVWWVQQHLRMVSRKRSIIEVRLRDALQRVEWTAVEFAILTRIDFHMRRRIQRLQGAGAEMQAVAEWVQKYLAFAVKQQIVLDSLQESIIREEINRLERDASITIEFDSLIEELLNSLQADNQYTAERVGLESRLKVEVYGSAKAIELNEQLLVLKTKQKQLTTHTLDALRQGLQEKFDAEDTANLEHFGFPNDDPDLPVEKFPSITAEPIEVYSASHHCRLADFLKVYLVQPWLAEQSVEDVRMEEQITAQQLSIGTLREKLKGLRTQVKLNDLKKTNNEKRIRTIRMELEGMYEGKEDEGDSEKAEREQQITAFQKEIHDLEVENHAFLNGRQQIVDQEGPLLVQIEQIAQAVKVIEGSLKSRADERERQSNRFFDIEKELSEELSVVAMKASADVEQDLVFCDKHSNLCDTFSSEDSVIQDLIENRNIDLHERKAINVPLQTQAHRVQELVHEMRPRVNPSAITIVRTTVETRHAVIRTNRKYFQALKATLDQEQSDLEEFVTKREYYEGALEKFNKFMVNSRRQRALQIDISQRLVRLEQLRGLRLKSMQEAKQRQLEREREQALIKAEKEAAKRTTTQVLAANTKKAIRAAKDAYRDLRYKNDVAMDPEEEKLAQYILDRNKEGVGSIPEAIKEIKFSAGAKDTDFVQRQNDHLRSKGLPYYRRMQRSIGNQVYIWTMPTVDSSLFITTLEFSHKDPDHPSHKPEQKMRKQRYELIECDETDLMLWVKRDRRKHHGIKSLALSFTEEEETRLIVEKFSKVEESLENYGLPDTYMWLEKVDKEKKVEGANVNKLNAELKKMQKMLDNKPNDTNMKGLVDRLKRKRDEAVAKEKAAEVADHLQAATDLLALSPHDIEQWQKVFNRADRNRDGKLSYDELFDFFEETPTPISRAVFAAANAMDEENQLDFGGFVRTCAIYCLFGKSEIVQFIYVQVDEDREGFITGEGFEQLMESMHPYEKMRARRVIKQLRVPKTGKLTYQEFQSLKDRFPAAFSPMFNLQDSMRKKTMGTDWWFVKMERYKEVRRKMGAEGKNTEALVDLELRRFTEDELRERRMAERAALIKQETSEVKKTILKARQFLDEFS